MRWSSVEGFHPNLPTGVEPDLSPAGLQPDAALFSLRGGECRVRGLVYTTTDSVFVVAQRRAARVVLIQLVIIPGLRLRADLHWPRKAEEGEPLFV